MMCLHAGSLLCAKWRQVHLDSPFSIQISTKYQDVFLTSLDCIFLTIEPFHFFLKVISSFRVNFTIHPSTGRLARRARAFSQLARKTSGRSVVENSGSCEGVKSCSILLRVARSIWNNNYISIRSNIQMQHPGSEKCDRPEASGIFVLQYNEATLPSQVACEPRLRVWPCNTVASTLPRTDLKHQRQIVFIRKKVHKYFEVYCDSKHSGNVFPE